jgi:hypothetical protein
LNKAVKVAVQNSVRIGFLVFCPEIFDQVIGMKDIGADLVSPPGRDVLTTEPQIFFAELFFFKSEQPGP